MIVVPYDNQPSPQLHGWLSEDLCEVEVDLKRSGKHQCGNYARFRIPDFDQWGDLLVCWKEQHKDGSHPRRVVNGRPTSWRLQNARA